jgi:alpha-amylase
MNSPVFRRTLFLMAALLTVFGFGMMRGAPATAVADPARTVFVHLFEWKWSDIAQECENFLGPKGFAAVQVSPPNEHRLMASQNYPWYQRYQPVSYQIESRGGTRAQFADMVSRCNAVGVDIYVDAVINHMSGVDPSGVGINGSTFSYYDYPGTYASWDFHHCGRNGNDDIVNYQDPWEVQNCELVNLSDLDTGSSYVRGKLVAYMNDLISLGVAGFRIDAAKHMSTNDINAIVSQLNGSPYIFQEVIDQGGEPISASDYFQNGDVTEFKYSLDLSRIFYAANGEKLAWLNGANAFGEDWGHMSSDKAVVFVDNHDNQRGHGGGGHIITYKDGTLYDLTNVFMLAWPYGYPKIMSSYSFTDPNAGPPADANGNTNDIYVNGTPNCFSQWQCEHRWLPIANMVEFRNVTSADFYVSNWWDNGSNQIAFGRGDKGFVVINKDGWSLNSTLQTGMAAGEYCNVLDGELNSAGTACTGSSITVNSNGTANFSVASWNAVAIHANAQVTASSQNVAVNFNVNATTYWGQNVYVVGNIAELGNWNTGQAVLLSAAGYPIWSDTVPLPPSTTIEFKYIKINGGNVVWESDSNRILNTPASGSVTLNDTWK